MLWTIGIVDVRTVLWVKYADTLLWETPYELGSWVLLKPWVPQQNHDTWLVWLRRTGVPPAWLLHGMNAGSWYPREIELADVKISHQSLSKQFIHQTKVLTKLFKNMDKKLWFTKWLKTNNKKYLTTQHIFYNIWAIS